MSSQFSAELAAGVALADDVRFRNGLCGSQLGYLKKINFFHTAGGCGGLLPVVEGIEDALVPRQSRTFEDKKITVIVPYSESSDVRTTRCADGCIKI